MTVKDVAEMAGISVQSVYKRFKANGLKVESLKNKETGHFTPAGEAEVERIFNLSCKPFKPDFKPIKPDSTEVERLKAEVEKLKESLNQVETEVERLTTALDLITEERDYLRDQVKAARDQVNAAQVIQMEALKKIPAALPAGEKKWRFPWFKRK